MTTTTQRELSDSALLADAVKHTVADDFSRAESQRLKAIRERLSKGARVVDVEGLSGAAEAAEMLGVERSTVTRWRKQDYMPEPFAYLRNGPVWITSDLVAFKAEHDAKADRAGRRNNWPERDEPDAE